MLASDALAMRLACVAFLVLAVGCAKKGPDRKTFAEAWQKAQAAGDEPAAWSLLDHASQQRIVEAITATLDTSKGDPERGRIFACMNQGIDAGQAPDAVAHSLFGVWLKAKGATLVDDGKTKHVHLEGGAWRASVDPVGLIDPDGRPLSMDLRLPADGETTPPAPPPSSDPQVLEVAVDFTDKTVEQIRAEYTSIAERIAEAGKLPPEYAGIAGRFLACDYQVRMKTVVYHIEGNGAITATVDEWNEEQLLVLKSQKPRLAYGGWPQP